MHSDAYLSPPPAWSQLHYKLIPVLGNIFLHHIDIIEVLPETSLLLLLLVRGLHGQGVGLPSEIS